MRRFSTLDVGGLIILCFHGAIAMGNRVPRQSNQPNVDLLGKPRNNGANALICCRCVSLNAACNNNLDENIDTNPGLTCKNEIEADVFGCDIDDITISDVSHGTDFLIDLRSNDNRCSLANGQKTCCDPAPSTFNNHITFDLRNDDDTIFLDTRAICQSDDVGATTNFEFGVACGKRDSRVYFDAGLEPGFTNPGEWPWSVLIYAGQGSQKRYIGSGALIDNDIVVTVAHKVRDFVQKAEELEVHVGDWDPNTEGGPYGDQKEEYSHVEMAVDCVKIHSGAALDSSLENNVAVLKLRTQITNQPLTVVSVISLKSGPRRRGDEPNGPPRTNLSLSDRDGLLVDNQEVDPLGEPRKKGLPPSYINTVCLPESEDQFTTETCWVAAWGSNRERQREVDLPLMLRSQCQSILEQEFGRKGVLNWQLKQSEVCAGGIPGKDTCQGEGGAPLVCYSRSRDQYYAVGLVSYGFGCNGTLPGVYTNLADKGVQDWIKQALGNPTFCTK